MEYILNESKIKTTNGFKINNIKVDLDLPEVLSKKEFKLISNEKENIKIDYIFDEEIIDSKIGLKMYKSYSLNIVVEKSIEDPIEFIYEFDNDSLVCDINIIFKKNTKADIIFKYVSKSNDKNFCYIKENLISEENSKGNITIVNMLNKNSEYLLSIENSTLENSNIIHNIIDIGSNKKIFNVFSKLNGDNSINKIYSMYIGLNNDLIDINYNNDIIGKNVESNINVKGILNDNAIKHFKGIIDFKENCKNSIGKENEDCIMLSDTCISRSLPMLLCHEENVIGNHGVSSGKIDEDKLFYLMSRGLSKEESIKMIIKGSFEEIINSINNDNIKEEITSKIDEIM